jgi:hypothetical protein
MIDEDRVHDPAATALDHLADVADTSATELHELQQDLCAMKEERRHGWTWRQIISASTAAQPLVHITRIAADLATATGAFRRALAKGLRNEGMRVGAIAGLFDVSRQRVSTLVRSDATTPDPEL